MTGTRLARIGVPATLALAPLSLAAPAAAAASPHGTVNVTVPCSRGSLSNLQVQREDGGRWSLDFGVDSLRHRAGIPWRVHVSDNGASVVSTTIRTSSDGSFSVSRALPAASTNRIVATATNLVSGERCRIARTA